MPSNFDGVIDIVVHEPDFRGLSGIAIGFERGDWRCARFSEIIIESLPDFSLPQSEIKKYQGYQATLSLYRRAAEIVFKSEKFKKRGEFGELILHSLIQSLFNTKPAISKIYFKDSPNDTVKGFDAVHVVVNGDEFELWLGESKFYIDINDAIRDVVKELEEHSKSKYLRTEFALILNKLDPSFEHSEKIQKLLDQNTSLDEIFKRVCIPILLTYESKTIQDYNKLKDTYKQQLEDEIRRHFATFSASTLPEELKIHLILFPLKNKAELNEKLKDRLVACQNV